MTQVTVHSGACGFQTTVLAETGADYQSKVKITSTCPHVAKLAETLSSLSIMAELFKRSNPIVLSTCHAKLPHVTCPVPIGILKCIEASANMALPKDVSIGFKS